MLCRYSLLFCCSAIMLNNCQPAPPLPSEIPKPKPTVHTAPNHSAAPPASTAPTPEPSLTASPPRITRTTIEGISFEGVSFDSRSHSLHVIDQPNGPGSKYSSARSAASAHGALLAINAGFFTPEGKPLGLVISYGNTTGSWNSASSLGSGIYHNSPKPIIIRRTSRSAIPNTSHLLQAGPLLIENTKPVSGLDPKKSAVRSLIITDGSSQWWIGRTSSCSLASLANAISQRSPSSWKAKTALNLDGGRSTDLFISHEIPGGPAEYRSFLNKPVRNFLILLPN